MKSEDYEKILMDKAVNRATRNWPEPDANKLRKMEGYIRTAKYSEILKSEQHKRDVDKLTYHTTSGRLCCWCLTTGCFNKRISSIPKNEKPSNRDDVDHLTMYMCATYRKKREDQFKEKTDSEERKKLKKQEERNNSKKH